VSLWQVVWIGYSCAWPLKALPDRLKPLLCSAGPDQRIYEMRQAADAKVRELGPGPSPRLFEVTPLGTTLEKKVHWRFLADIEP